MLDGWTSRKSETIVNFSLSLSLEPYETKKKEASRLALWKEEEEEEEEKRVEAVKLHLLGKGFYRIEKTRRGSAELGPFRALAAFDRRRASRRKRTRQAKDHEVHRKTTTTTTKREENNRKEKKTERGTQRTRTKERKEKNKTQKKSFDWVGYSPLFS